MSWKQIAVFVNEGSLYYSLISLLDMMVEMSITWISISNLGQHWSQYISLETPKRVIRKGCRPRSDAAECGI